MLTHLSITNYAIIEQLELRFSGGFTTITGETGAGKSILLGALSMILGQRADTSVLNDKTKKCIIEGQFELSKKDYSDFFSFNDLDFEKQTILRREININGKSRAFINDTPVTLNLLKELAQNLVDIHSQHQTLNIKKNAFQINVLDAFAHNSILLNNYQEKYFKFKAELKVLEELKKASANSATDKDYIEFQVKEIEELNLKPNEKEELENELELINNSEEIKRVIDFAELMLTSSDQSVLQSIKNIENQFFKISTCSPDYNDIYDRLKSLYIELNDISNEISKHNEDFGFNPDDVTYLNNRLSKIYSIEQKHRVNSTKEILEIFSKLQKQLDNVNSYDEKIEKQETLVNQLKIETLKIAKELSQSRNKSIPKLENQVLTAITELGIPNANFIIQKFSIDEPNEFGTDAIEFLFTANKGVKPQELNKVASGGELSRLMLTFKAILVKTKKLPTIIFDEIDTGVSGDIADKMADIMTDIANQSQVIAITHLPQVAAKGNEHFKVYKLNNNKKTLTMVDKLSKEERVEELAKMLSGKNLTKEARENAKVLLKN